MVKYAIRTLAGVLVFEAPLATLPRKFGRFALMSLAWAAAGPPGLTYADEGKTGFVIEEWNVPNSCGEQGHFEALVREAVGDWPGQTPPVRVAIEVTPARRRLSLVMTTEGVSGSGTRTLKARTCEELLATAAVVLSLALDSEALYDNERETQVVTVPKPSPAETATSPKQIGDDETPSMRQRDQEALLTETGNSETLDTGLRLVALSDVGTLPRPALGLGVVASAHSGPYQVSFRLTRWAEQVQFVGDEDNRGGSFDLLSGSLHVCREFSHGRFPVGLCVLGSVARMSATGIADQPNSAVNALASAGVAVFHDLPMGPTRIRLHAETLGQFVRPRYTVKVHEDPTDVDRMEIQVHQPSEVTVRLGASWGLSF